VCAGAFVLAAAGLLDGRRATTHWELAADLARTYPQVTLDADAIFVADGPIHTSAGVTAGIGLCLALADRGAELARDVARHVVVFMQRLGGQVQFSVRLDLAAPTQSPLRHVLDDIAHQPLTRDARRASGIQRAPAHARVPARAGVTPLQRSRRGSAATSKASASKRPRRACNAATRRSRRSLTPPASGPRKRCAARSGVSSQPHPRPSASDSARPGTHALQRE
jgi:hypothetical protein